MDERPDMGDQRSTDAAKVRNPRRARTVRNIVLLSAAVVVVVAGFAVVVGHLAAKPSSAASFGVPALPSIPAGADFSPLDKANAVPANVLDALAVPAGSTVVSRANKAIEAPFDGTVTYTSAESPGAIAKFFPAELAQQHWRVNRSMSPILAVIGGTDSNYWEVGVTISSIPSSGSGHPDGTRFSVELLTYVPGGD